jgi:2,3-dimethylmalate lyase
VTNAFVARLAERAGFELVFTTGAGIANTAFGIPDLGLTTMTEMIDATRRIVESTHLPVVADADTGYGNHLNVIRTTGELEHAGVAGLFMEDQVAPKKCGHFDNKSVIGIEEMVAKIVAARMTLTNEEFVIIARTDAIASEGLESALERAKQYAHAGADMIFVEAPRSLQELEAIPANIPVPCMANMVEGGKTPLVAARDLEAMGYKIVVYANLALRMAANAVAHAFATLRDEGTSESLLPQMLSWEKRQEIVELPEWQRIDREIALETRRLLEGSHA